MHMPLISTMVWNLKRTSLLPRRYLGRIYVLLSLHANSEWRVASRRRLAARMTFSLGRQRADVPLLLLRVLCHI